MHSLSSRPQIIREHHPLIFLKNYTCRFLHYDTHVFTIVASKNSAIYNNSSNSQKVETNNHKIDLKKLHYKDLAFYSTPMVRKTQAHTNKHKSCKEIQNVLLAFVCPYHAQKVKKNLFDQFPSVSMQVIPFNLQELSYQVSILQMPLAIIITSFCDLDEKKEKNDDQEVYDIFFTQRYLENPPEQ